MPERLALLDLGSNAVRFLLAEIGTRGAVRVLREDRAQTRLGAGALGRLSRRAVSDTLHAARRFLRSVRRDDEPRVIAVATSAVRDAANRDRLLEPLRREGVSVEVLSGDDEARLGAAAALASLPLSTALVLDLGGGSLQLTQVREHRVVSAVSLPLGAVRLTRRFLHDDPPTERQVRALRREVRDRLIGALPPPEPDEAVVGMGGTVRALARLKLEGTRRHQRHGLRLARTDVSAIRERLAALPVRKRRRLPGLKAERADIILAGALVIEEVLALGGRPALMVCTRGVRDGVLLREALGAEALP
jgi:exopolyphosphatase/guanosine-5'-triphosphate,3'-diphosphate pyrophosphatase